MQSRLSAILNRIDTKELANTLKGYLYKTSKRRNFRKDEFEDLLREIAPNESQLSPIFSNSIQSMIEEFDANQLERLPKDLVAKALIMLSRGELEEKITSAFEL